MKVCTGIELSVSSNELVINTNGQGARIRLENQLVQILMLLLEAKGETVEKKDFIDQIWQGNSLTGDTALTKNIFRLREIVKSEAVEGKLRIETVPKKGYRLLVTESMPADRKKGVPLLPVLLAGALVLCVLLFWVMGKSSRTQPAAETIVAGSDTVILLGDKKVRVIDLDTLKGPVFLKDPGE